MRSAYVLVLIVAVHKCCVEGILLGGLTNLRKATPEVQAVADSVREELESTTGAVFQTYVAEQYATQVVNGLNYFIKVRVGDNEYVHLKVYRSFDGELGLIKYKLGLTAADPLIKF